MKQIVKGVALALGSLAVTLLATVAFAQGGEGIAGIADKVTTQAGSIAKLLNVAAYVAGVGFALAGVLQFKAHKEDPRTTPLSKPVVMLIVAACLLFLPAIMDVAGKSLGFADDKSSAKFKSNVGGT